MTQSSGRTLLLANGHPPGSRLWAALAERSSLVCCVDGGADTALRMGVRPAAVFGDFDSVSQAARRSLPGCEWVETADQEFTDLDKAISCLIGRGCRDISVAGGVGRRVDHSLGNLSLTLKHRQAARVTFHTQAEDVFLLEGRWNLTASRGRRVSLFPLFGRARITTLGLRYPLQDEYLQMGVRDGISNQALGGLVEVVARQNPVLVCVGRCWRDGVVFAPVPTD